MIKRCGECAIPAFGMAISAGVSMMEIAAAGTASTAISSLLSGTSGGNLDTVLPHERRRGRRSHLSSGGGRAFRAAPRLQGAFSGGQLLSFHLRIQNRLLGRKIP